MITMIKRYFLSEAVQMPKPNDKKDITVDDITNIVHRHDKQNAMNYATKHCMIALLAFMVLFLQEIQMM